MNIEQYFFVFDIELEFLYYTKTSYKLNFMAVEQIEKKFRTKEIFWQGTPYIYLKGLVIFYGLAGTTGSGSFITAFFKIDDLTFFRKFLWVNFKLEMRQKKHNLFCKMSPVIS